MKNKNDSNDKSMILSPFPLDSKTTRHKWDFNGKGNAKTCQCFKYKIKQNDTTQMLL